MGHNPQSESPRICSMGDTRKDKAIGTRTLIQLELKKCGHMAEGKSTQLHTDHFYSCCFLAYLRDLTRMCQHGVIVR